MNNLQTYHVVVPFVSGHNVPVKFPTAVTEARVYQIMVPERVSLLSKNALELGN